MADMCKAYKYMIKIVILIVYNKMIEKFVQNLWRQQIFRAQYYFNFQWVNFQLKWDIRYSR